MRKLALVGAIAALWLFVAAATAFADGGPHTMATNNGSSGISADSCAGCHRAHTATAASLLSADQPQFCLNCHNGTKATTDVVDGYQLSSNGGTSVLGALRSGGFQFALIDSSDAARLGYLTNHGSGDTTGFIGHIQPLGVKAAVTSTHGGLGGIYAVDASGHSTWGIGTVWGNGAPGTANVGPQVQLECSSCHNPHGNGEYRILQTTPSLTATSGTFTVTNSGGVAITDTASTGLHNYTIRPSTDGSVNGLVTGTQGDYWRYKWDPNGVIPWTTLGTDSRLGAPYQASPLSADPMNTGWDGVSVPTNSTGAMTAWCIQCHTRYNGYSTTVTNGASNYTPGGRSASSLVANSADSIFMFKHGTTRIGCEQCHVAHGSDALMAGNLGTNPSTSYSLTYSYPGSTASGPTTTVSVGGLPVLSGDSRLLKVDNRGTCQMCHDPTGTVDPGYYVLSNNTYLTPGGTGVQYYGLFTTAPAADIPGN